MGRRRVVVLLGVSTHRGRIGAEQLRRAACEAGPAVGRRGLGLDQRLQVGASGQDRLDGAVVRRVVGKRALASRLQSDRAVAFGVAEHALGSPQPLDNAVAQQEGDEFNAARPHAGGLAHAPLTIALEVHCPGQVISHTSIGCLIAD